MFCMVCGNKLADGAKFCPSCGSPVAAAPAPSEAVFVDEAVKAAAQPEVKEEIIENQEDVSQSTPVIEEASEIEDVEVEESSVSLESEVDTSLDPSVLAALETPDIPESEIDVDELSDTLKSTEESEDKPEPEAVTPVQQEVNQNVTPVQPVSPVAEPVKIQSQNSVIGSVPVQPSQPQSAPVPPVIPVPPVAPATPMMPLTGASTKSAPKVKKEKEAFKIFALLGILITLAGCFLNIHKFNNWDGEEYVSRTDKQWEFTEGQIIIAAMVIALVFVILRLSAFALTGVVASWVSYALFCMRFYYYQSDILKDADVAFKLEIGTFLIWAGLVISLIGLFIKFGKKKLFKI